MKKSIIFLLITLLIFTPLISAENYSKIERFTDNIKLFVFQGDKKVETALEIREKEVNSAIENFNNGNEEESVKNIERATKKLQIVQEKVSYNIANEVKENIENHKEKIGEYENVSENFGVYLLEEEKTKLTTELVMEVEGKEGQTLEREIVKDEKTGQRIVKVVIEYDDGTQEILEGGQIQNNVAERVIEIQGQITQVQNQIAERVVKIEMAKGAEMQNKLESEIKTSGDIEKKEDVESGGGYAEGTIAGGDSPENTIDDTYDDAEVNSGGDCGDGVICGGENDVIENIEGSPGVQEEPSSAVDSNEGDDSITGEVIKRIFNRLR